MRAAGKSGSTKNCIEDVGVGARMGVGESDTGSVGDIESVRDTTLATGLSSKLLSVIRSQNLAPVAVVCCHALMPFTGLLENLGFVLAADRSNLLRNLFELVGSRPALEDFVRNIELSQLEQRQDAGN